MELYNIFKKNINNIDFDESILESTKNNITTKKDLQYFLNSVELLNRINTNEQSDKYYKNYDYLYPHLDDELLNIKISNLQEFKEHKYNVNIEKIKSIEEEAEKLCNSEFELLPHQMFIKNFLSNYTPYNSLFLYHGLGTGKTCSAISIAEETREFLKLNGYKERIIIVASRSVQTNFKLQLFDERKLKLENGKYSIDNCAGNNFLKDINMLKSSVSKEKVVKIVDNIISSYYLFMGYIEFANLIIKKSNIDNVSFKALNSKEKNKLIKNKLQKFFGNRLVIIDEIHNIRESSSDESSKLVAKQLSNLVKYVYNMKLVLMSATPMYNDYKEIIYIANLLNLNDKRSTIEFSDVFNNDGTFVTDIENNETGKDLLKRKLNGYISYVKGDNPFTFPYRILPSDYNKEKSITSIDYPLYDLKNNRIDDKIRYFDLYLNNVNSYQEHVYNYIIYKTDFHSSTAFKYTELQKPLMALNIVYPNSMLESTPFNDFPKLNINSEDLIAKNGLHSILTSSSDKTKYNYRFIDESSENIFLKENIGKYSIKIKNILDAIENSEGVVIIYSQFIEAGLIPMALALECNGFKKFGNNSLFTTPQSDVKQQFNYMMITGDKLLTDNLKGELKAITDSNNVNGNIIKVVLLSMAGSEGIDFKFIRQIHIMEPWYNINRMEQIIGRGIRNCSHKDLELVKRNAKIFMHTSLLENKTIETVDMLLYRKAEIKAIQIGKITRLMKETSVDCILNFELNNYNSDVLEKYNKSKLQQILSNNEVIEFTIGDRPQTALCDYMETCKYNCNNQEQYSEIEDTNSKSYNESFLETNNTSIINKVKELFLEKYFYTKIEILSFLNNIKSYSIYSINNALTELVENSNYIIKDKYGKIGKVINIDELYIFQPLTNEYDNSSMYSKIKPIEYNNDNLTFKVPDSIKKPIDKKMYANATIKIVDKFADSNEDLYTTRQGNTNLIFSKLCEEYNNIMYNNTEYLKKLKSKNSHIILLAEIIEKFKNFKSKNKLFDLSDKIELEIDKTSKKINKKEVNKLIIQILIDKFNFESHKSLIEYVFDDSIEVPYVEDIEKELFLIIKEYYTKNMLISGNQKAFIFDPLIIDKKDIEDFAKDFNYSLFVLNNNKLLPGTPLNYSKDFVESINLNKIDLLTHSNTLGFIKIIDLDNDDNMKYNYIFKIKELKDSTKKNGNYNSGKVCSSHSQTDLKTIIDSFNIKELPNLQTKHLCLLVEIMLRYYNNIKKDGNIWFFNVRDSLINKF